MKKNRKWLIPAAVVLIAAAAVIALTVPSLLRSRKTSALVDQHNYVAARLLFLGSYEEGRTLAAETDQLSTNTTSRELLTLADGFQEYYEAGAERAAAYLETSDSTVLTTLQEVYEEFLSEAGDLDAQLETGELDEVTYDEELSGYKEELQEELVILLLEVQNSIDVTVDSETVQAMLTYLQEGAYSLSSEEFAALEEDDSLLASEVKTSAALAQGDYAAAFEGAQEILETTGSFENRAAVANIAASYSEYLGEDEEITALAAERSDLYMERNELRSSGDSSATTLQTSLELQIEKVEAEIAELTAQMELLPVQKAINYIETTTPASDRSGASYQLELAQLYYLSGDEETADEYLAGVLLYNDGTDAMAQLVEEFVEAYQVQNGSAEGAQYSDSSADPEEVWNRIASMLGFTSSYSSSTSYNSYYYNGYYYGASTDGSDSESFYDHVISFLYDTLYGITIRSIDASEFPTVTIAVNVSADTEQTLTEENFSITELGVEIEDFTILNQEDLETAGDYSIILVVDRSGSMGSDGMEDAKDAVSTFIRSAGASSLGLVAFNSTAERITEPTTNHSLVLQGVESLSSGGGTSIYLGLQEAADMLRGASGTKIIILMSDGCDGSTDMIDSVISDINKQGITVYTIGVGSGIDTEYLSNIAARCGGRFLQAESTSDLTEVYLQIGTYVTNDYVIQFTVDTDPEEFSRYVQVSTDVTYGTAEKEYSVGVSYEDILTEDELTPMTDFIYQVGGSYRGSGEEDEEEEEEAQ